MIRSALRACEPARDARVCSSGEQHCSVGRNGWLVSHAREDQHALVSESVAELARRSVRADTSPVNPKGIVSNPHCQRFQSGRAINRDENSANSQNRPREQRFCSVCFSIRDSCAPCQRRGALECTQSRKKLWCTVLSWKQTSLFSHVFSPGLGQSVDLQLVVQLLVMAF